MLHLSPETDVLYRDDRWHTPLLLSWLNRVVIVMFAVSLVGLLLTLVSWGVAFAIGESLRVELGVSALLFPLFLGFLLHRLVFSPPVVRLVALDPAANQLILHTATVRSWRDGLTQQTFALDGVRDMKLRRKEGKVILQLASGGRGHQFTLCDMALAEQLARALTS